MRRFVRGEPRPGSFRYAGPMRVVCISDTHGLTADLQVPDGDLLLHAGDLTGGGSLAEIAAAHAFLTRLPHRHKIVIAGNHDFGFEREPAAARALMTDCIYLQDESVEIEGLRIWGSPWQPWFYDWAFNLERGPALAAKWDQIPADTDILITHGPPRGQGDVTISGESVGCDDLLAAVQRVRPRWHVFGHIHEGFGTNTVDGTTFINASTCTVGYEPTNPPLTFRTD